jgi:coenzyme F420-0:L-glutamate ligase/coenzyme F420-1:gamma-L-glutamate ligase
MAGQLTDSQAAWLATRRVAHLATTGTDGAPHVVPVCFAWDGAACYIALDAKPKRVAPTQLKRVRNILANPQAALICDTYDEDWQRLGYLLIHGAADLLDLGPAHAAAIALLREKYPQYQAMPIETQPLIRITPSRITAWGVVADATELAASDAHASVLRTPLDLTALMRGRRSVRVYQDRPVDRALVEQVLEAGRWAPSPHGRQPWRFVVLTQPGAKTRLADAMAAEWDRNLAMDGQDAGVVATRLAKSRERLLNAPVLILLCLYLEELDRYPDPDRQAAETTMAIQSLGAMAENMLLMGYGLGLDGGWMCAPLFCPETVVAALDLDPALIPHALLTLGYAARDPVRRPRKPLDELIVRYE